MRGYLIDPATRSFWEVETDGSLHAIYQLLNVDCIDVVRVNRNGDVIYVDDIGLLRNPTPPLFTIKNYPQPLAGRGLLLGTDGEGEATSPTLDLAAVAQLIEFPQGLAFSHFEEVSGTTTIGGEEVPMIGNRAVFKKEDES